MTTAPIEHDRKLYAALLELARRIDPAVRAGSMFGCPAIYQGRKLAACIYGSGIAFKVPEDLARTALEARRAVPFTPYGKAPMREWIMASPQNEEALADFSNLLSAALSYAKANNK